MTLCGRFTAFLHLFLNSEATNFFLKNNFKRRRSLKTDGKLRTNQEQAEAEAQ